MCVVDMCQCSVAILNYACKAGEAGDGYATRLQQVGIAECTYVIAGGTFAEWPTSKQRATLFDDATRRRCSHTRIQITRHGFTAAATFDVEVRSIL